MSQNTVKTVPIGLCPSSNNIFQKLPYEIVSMIIKKLDLKDLYNLVNVSQFFKDIINADDEIFKKTMDLLYQKKDKLLIKAQFESGIINLSPINLLVNDMMLISIIKKCPHLTQINLTSSDITDKTIIDIASNCPNLKQIILCNCKNITDKSVIVLVKKCSKLIHIDLERCHITDTSVINIAEYCKELIKISLNRCYDVTNRGLFILSSKCSPYIIVDSNLFGSMIPRGNT